MRWPDSRNWFTPKADPAHNLWFSRDPQAIAAANFSGVLTNAIPSLNRFQLVTGTVGLTWHNARVSFGKQSLWWGSSESGALLMSDNAEAIPMFRIQNAEPFRIPLLSSLLGPVDVQFFLGQLSGHHWEINSPNLVGPDISRQPFMHGEKISFRPKKNLEFGMGVTAMFAGALVGALLVVHVNLVVPLGIAAVLLAASAIAAHRLSAGAPDWT